MIKNFKHRGLKRLFEKGDRRKINPNHLDKIELILADLNTAETIADLRLPGYRLHELHGDLKGFFTIDVSGNWRIIFKFKMGVASKINLLDYH
ncbi:MAG: type II toxin-antitoxin system RelE/ParE family toxin [Pseudomonadales bacterium]|nr:type II toxin-antitoxin system RelE/ParE family toxin [Pseudomonadales bacterium]